MRFLRFWSLAVGAMDAITGLLLVFVPAGVLRLLGIRPPDDGSMVFLSWIGVFVMSVGLSYGLVFLKRRHGEAVWAFTSLVRMAVAVFLTTMVLKEIMETAWLLVAASDAAVALVQIVILRLGWWREGVR